MAVASPLPSSFSLRRADAGDFDAYMDAFEAVAAEGRWLGAEAPLERDVRRAGFDRAVAGEGAVLYLAEAGGRIAGAISAFLERGVVDLGMFVVDGQRGGGVGSALLEAVIDWARSVKAHKISLAAWPTNHPAIGLYARHGFRNEGTRRRQYRRRNGALWDAVWMGLVLDEESGGGPGPARTERPPLRLPDGGIGGLLPGAGAGGIGGVPPAAGVGGGSGAGGGGRIVLREWHRSDIAELVTAIDGMEGRQWLQAIPHPYTADDAAEYIAFTTVQRTAGAALELAVVVDGSLAGAAGLRVGGPDGSNGEIGYWVAAAVRGRGVATTAARLLSDFGFEALGLRRIELNAAVENTASRRVAEKAGFELEGIRRAWRLVDGVPTDHALYSRIAETA